MINTPFEFLNSSIRIAPGRRVVPAEDYAKYNEANEILELAREKARHIEGEASQAYEERRLQGYRDGLGQANDEKAVFCFQIAQDFSNVVLKIEDKLASLFPQIVRNLLGDLGEELSFKSYISRALQDLVNEEKLVIKVHPSKRTLIEEHIESLQKKNGDSFKYIRVASDTTLEGDQATIETTSSIVVLDLQKQLDVLQEYAKSRLAEMSSSDLLTQVAKKAQEEEPGASEGQSQDWEEEFEEAPFRVFD
jgi:type III secretion system HrpE/YscL family protein